MVAQLDVYDTLPPPIIGYSVLRIHLSHVERKQIKWHGVSVKQNRVVGMFVDFH